MSDAVTRILRGIPAVLLLAAVLGVPGPAAADSRRFVTGFAGTLTENRWHEVFEPGALDLAGSGLLGAAYGWERRIGNSRFSIGFEVQALGHFGRQDHFEFNLPLVLRYTPPNPRPRRFKSFAFGVGPSHATKVPQVELDRTGEAQRNFVYWMAETEFALRRPDTTWPDTTWPDTTWYVRLHHRSDGYGLYDANGGSTALAVGWRRSF